MTDHQREKFEAAVVQRLKESGFLEVEIRTEALVRCDDGYQDEVINAGWHYWNAALVAAGQATAALVLPNMSDEEIEHLQESALTGDFLVAFDREALSQWGGRPRENPQWTSEELQQFATTGAGPLAMPRLHVKTGDGHASVLLGAQQLIATAEPWPASASSDYSELEALAKAATPGPHHIYTFARDDKNGKANEAFIAAVWPQVVLDLISKARQTPPPSSHVAGYAAGMEHAVQIAEGYDQTDTLTAPKAIASAIRAASISAATAETRYTGRDDLTDCFRHHITTTIGWLAFGARPGPEMQMYEEGFKAGYRRCQSDNEMDLGEEEDGLSARARKLVRKLRESIKSGAAQLADVEDAIDLIVDQAAKTEGRP